MAEVQDIGDVVRIRTSPVFANALGVATDPTTVTLTVREPNGTTTAYTYGAGQLTKAGTGDYYRDVTITAAGRWAWEFIGTGIVAAGASGSFRVRESAVS